jgi:hypothetical protein
MHSVIRAPQNFPGVSDDYPKYREKNRGDVVKLLVISELP